MSRKSEADTVQGGDLSRQATAWMVQLDDEPDNEALRLEFLDWLSASPHHLAAWEETTQVSGLMTAVGALPIDRPVVPVVPARVAWRRRLPSKKGFASVALAACLVWTCAPDLAIRFQSDTITGTGELRLVKLTDGSIVHLAPATAIAFTDSAKGRTLKLLRGEAWLDVAHDRARPFSITAGDSTVTVLGTAFSVRKMDAGAEVAVARGRVAVTNPDGVRPGQVVLVAGQSVAVADKGIATRGTIRPDRVASWRDGVEIVNDQSIGSVIERIRPWYKGYILVRGPGLMDRRVSGIYDLRDPDRAFEALARAHKVKVSHISPWMRIVTVS